MSRNNKKGLSAAELSNFCGQVALILEAGLPLYDGMETLAGADKDSANADMYVSASNGVTESGSLYSALKEDGRWPEYLVEMVGIGERSGQLEKVMRGLESYYAREDRIHSSVVSAVTYPLVLGIMLVLIVLILLWRVLPVFRRVLSSMGVGTSAVGGALMGVGTTIGWIALVVVGLAILAVLVGVVLLRTGAKESVLNVVRKLFPPIKRLSMKLSSSRVASVLSMMLSSGFPTGEAFRLMPTVISDGEAAAKVQGIRTELDEGQSFADAISHSKLFDGLQDRMIRMGVAAGREDQVMASIATQYEEQVEDGISQLVAIIEPTLIAVLSIVIGAILLSVMLPMAGMLSSML